MSSFEQTKARFEELQSLPPEPLRAPLLPAEDYPVEMLGDVLGCAALALHETVKAPLAVCCQGVLASASLAAQAHFDIELPYGEVKPLSLFLLTVAESGERKTGVDSVVLKAAKIQEKQDMTVYRQDLEQYDQELALWKATSESVNKKSAKAHTQKQSDLAGEEQHTVGNKPMAPILPLRFVSDPTVEGLYRLMSVSQPSIGLFSDEGGLLIGGHALNSDNALKTMARWCKLWDGSPFDRVRAGDGCDVLYGRRMALHLAAQPEVMAKLLSDRTANGQGLLARCLPAWPETEIGTRFISSFEKAAELDEIKTLYRTLKTLYEATPNTGENEQELDPIKLQLTTDAVQIAIDAHNQFEKLMQTGNDLAELRDRTSKALENACRIAGVMAVVENGTGTTEITAEHLKRGLVLMQWYLAEALRIRSVAMVPQSVIDAEQLLMWLESRGSRQFRSTTIFKSGPNGLRNKPRFEGAIKVLTQSGHIIENQPGTELDGVQARRSWRVMHYVV